MALFGPRLSTQTSASGTTIRWRYAGLVDIVGLVLVPMMVVWGIASAWGARELGDMQVIHMSAPVTAVYWAIVVGLAAHIVFNRGVTLRIEPGVVTWKLGRFPPRERSVDCSRGLDVSIRVRENPIAESVNGQSIEDVALVITAPSQPPIVIKDLSEDDAKTIERLLGQARAHDQAAAAR